MPSDCGSAGASPSLVGQFLIHLGLIIVLAGMNAGVLLAAEDYDTVIVATGQDGRGRLKRQGTVVDYSRDGLRLLQFGRETNIPAEKIIDVQTTLTEDQKSGDREMAEEDFAQALVYFNKVIEARKEQRDWVLTRMFAAMVRCYLGLHQREEAAEVFLRLVRADPDTPYFDHIPLAWTAGETQQPRRAFTWLSQRDNAAAMLLGASHLLATGERSSAVTTLERLRRHPEALVARLAEAQLWRTEVVTASSQQVDLWQRRLEEFPESLRGGPWYVAAQALARNNRHEEAALAAMRVAILHAHDRTLAAEALLVAAKSLTEINQTDEASSVYREIVEQYPEARAKSEAEQRLADLSARKRHGSH